MSFNSILVWQKEIRKDRNEMPLIKLKKIGAMVFEKKLSVEFTLDSLRMIVTLDMSLVR